MQRNAPACARCEGLPVLPGGAGDLYFWFPLDHVIAKVMRALRERGRRPEQTQGAVRVPLEEGELAACAAEASAAMTPEEAGDSRALFLPGGGQPALADLARISSLKELHALGGASWLLELLGEGRLTSHFQPIVDAKDTTRIFGHEALLRGIGPDGALIPPFRILGTARDAGMLFQVDLAARKTAVRTAARHQLQTSLFINFSPAAIYDPQTCLRTTVAVVEELGIAHEQLVFEVIEADRIADVDHLKGILSFYRAAGFRVALDDLGAGWSTLNLVHQLRPDFIKLDQELVRGVHRDPVKALIAQKLLEIGQGLGITTIVEGVEDLDELRWAREHGADLVQGYVVARPAAVPLSSTPAL